MNVEAHNTTVNTPLADGIVRKAEPKLVEPNPATMESNGNSLPSKAVADREGVAKKNDRQNLSPRRHPDTAVVAESEAAPLTEMERLRSELSAARSELTAARSEAVAARTEARQFQSELARTERLLSVVSSERDDALLRRDNERHSLRRETDALRAEVGASEAECRELRARNRELQAELRRVSAENDAAREDARMVLRAFDELRAQRSLGDGESPQQSKKQTRKQGKRGSVGKVLASLSRMSGNEVGMKSAIQTAAQERMHYSEGSISYNGYNSPEHHPPQQYHSRASIEAKAYSQVPPKAPLQPPPQRYTLSQEELTPQSFHTSKMGQRAAPVAAFPPTSAPATSSSSAAAKILAARSAIAASNVAGAGPTTRQQLSKSLQYPPAGKGDHSFQPQLQPQAPRAAHKPAYISNVKEGDVAKCYTPSVA